MVADSRSREGDEQVQVFDALGRPSRTFRVGDAIEHLLTDAAGDLWVGYFDEGVYGDDPLSAPGLRRWSSTGESVWSYQPVDGADWISDCDALNVSGHTAWACTYTDFPLLEIGAGHAIRVRKNPVQGSRTSPCTAIAPCCSAATAGTTTGSSTAVSRTARTARCDR